MIRPDGCMERIWKVLNTEVGLGVRPSKDKTRPTVVWTAPNRFVVRFQAIDDLGNVAVPSTAGVVQLLYQREPIAFVHNERADGVFELEVAAAGQGAKADVSGKCFEGAATLQGLGGRKINIPKGTPLDLSVRIGSTVLPVTDVVTEAKGGAKKKAAKKRARRK